MAENITNGAAAQPADIEMADQQQAGQSNGTVVHDEAPIAPVTQIVPQAPAEQATAPPTAAKIVPDAPVEETTPRPPAQVAPVAQIVSTPPTRNSSQPPAFLPPEKPVAHGSPTRVYINQNVTPHLLEGMKYLAAYEPEKPLKWLSEFLARKSAEVEGS
ncbi:hypothetical protein MBLNU457_7660t1 [Dothideomycetes sp. NU457]